MTINISTAPAKSPQKSCRRRSMEQEGGDGKGAASLQCTEKWKTKSITARSKMRGRTECLPCGMFFSMQKASQMYVRPFCGADLPWPKLHVGMTQGQAACHHLKNFQENRGAIKNCKEMIHISSQFFFISQSVRGTWSGSPCSWIRSP